jgi:gliding motility-associated-like protein
MDEKLRHILKEKLEAHESAVPSDLWEKVSANVGSKSVGALSQAKWFIAAALSAGIIGLSVWAVRVQKAENTSTHTESTTQPITEPPTEQPKEKVDTGNTKESAHDAVSSESLKTSTQEWEAESVPEPLVNSTTAYADSRKTETPAEPDPVPSETTPLFKASSAIDQSERTSDSFSAVHINRYDLAFFFIPTNPKAEQYQWDFGDGEQSDEMSPQHTYDEPGIYQVSLLTTAFGETTLTHQLVECLPASQLHVPTIFTPNGDGKNDLFDILALSKFLVIKEFRIFDEKGSLVYSSDNGEAWNGVTPSGIDAAEGNYLYHIQARDLRQQPVEKSGIIYLRR